MVAYSLVIALFISSILFITSINNEIQEQFEKPVLQNNTDTPFFKTTKYVSKLPSLLNHENVNTKNTQNLTGVFRGDWGKTLIYNKNDRINYDGNAYLSLLDENQNQVPNGSDAYWQKLSNNPPIDMHNCEAPAPQANLKHCDFSETNVLKNLDLKGADLSKAIISGDMGAADISNANLSGASIIGSLIINPETYSENTNFSNLQSDGNNPLIAENALLSNSNFSNANLYGVKMKGALLENSNFNSAILTSADLEMTNFQGANLSNTELTYANLTSGIYNNTQAKSANFTSANLSYANFSDANLEQANLIDADLNGAIFFGTNLKSTDLSLTKNAQNSHIDKFTDFTDAICPDGIKVNGLDITSCVGHGF